MESAKAFGKCSVKEVVHYTTGQNRWEAFIIVTPRTRVELRTDFRYLYWVDKLHFSSNLQLT